MHPLNPICPLHPIISPLENTHRFTHIKYSNALAWNLDMTGWIGRKTPRHSSPARVPCFPASRFQDTLQAERPESIAALGLHKQSESFPGIPRSCPQVFSTFVGFSTPKKHNMYPQGQITIYCFTFSHLNANSVRQFLSQPTSMMPLGCWMSRKKIDRWCLTGTGSFCEIVACPTGVTCDKNPHHPLSPRQISPENWKWHNPTLWPRDDLYQYYDYLVPYPRNRKSQMG